MTVRRIVTNVAAQDTDLAYKFYRDLLGLEIVMDQGWIKTFAGPEQAPVQISVATQGGNGTRVPDMTIEVTDIDATFEEAGKLGFEITYPLCEEPWGVRRFFLRDPFGKLVNIMAHTA